LHPPNFEWASATISMHLWHYHAALNSCLEKMGKFVGAWRWEPWRCYNKIKHLCCCLKGDLSNVQWQTKESSMMKLWSKYRGAYLSNKAMIWDDNDAQGIEKSCA
jgi:hypothetical protein